VRDSEFTGSESWHGTVGGKSNYGCKCPKCRKAWTEHCLARRDERAKAIRQDDPRHGTYSFYANHGCRCGKCRDANAEACRQQRLQKGGKP
jgi:hypothetical protein